VKTTIPDLATAGRADRIRRDFTADTIGAEYEVARCHTYIATWEGWLHPSVVEIASRRVVPRLADRVRTDRIVGELSN
jgi:putative transposase